jgi:uncharacterized protein YbjT (DUF2867 family)
MQMHPSEDAARQPAGQAVIVDADGLPALFEALHGRGYTVVGPTRRDGAIVVAELGSAADRPARSHGKPCCIRPGPSCGPRTG